MKTLILILILAYSVSGLAYVCNSNPVKLPDWALQFNWKGKYIGQTSSNKPAFYDETTGHILIFKDLNKPGTEEAIDNEISPQMFKWVKETEWRISETRSWESLQAQGLKDYIKSIGIKCGAETITDPVNLDVIKKIDQVTMGSGKCLEINASFPETGGRCCDGLSYNPTKHTCDIPTLVDSSLKTCSTHTECAGGFGCLPQTTDLMFVNGATEDEDDPISNLKGLLQDQLTQDGLVVKSIGETCTHPSQCVSYSCEAGVCKDAKVCRYAEEGETAPGMVECAPKRSLIKDTNNKCVLSPDAANGVYLGLIDEATFEPIGQCQFKVDKETQEAAIAAMKTMRAMEWLLGTISRDYADDCFSVIPVLKDEISTPFIMQRKNILGNFSLQLSQIENDFMDLVNAKKSDLSKVEVHGSLVTNNDLATRQSSGYDTLMIMYRRNLLFQQYEKAMLEAVKHAHERMAKLSEGMAKWNDGDKSWDIGGKVINSYQCKAHWQKWTVLRFWAGWKDKYYMNVADRWTDYYEVTGNNAENSDIMTRKNVLAYLEQMSGTPAQDLKSVFTSKHYLLDPLMPGDKGSVSFANYGQVKNLKKSGFLGLSKTRDLRKPRYLKGSGTGSYTAIYKDMRARLIEFYKRYNTDEAKKFPHISNFVYEPELVLSTAKDCIEKIDKPLTDSDHCGKFKVHFEELLDNSFAQFVAYSFHTNSKYSNYFRNATTWRRRLLAKYETDMANISKYYDTIIKHRNIQNECIERVTNQVVREYTGQGNTGLKEGASTNYYDSNYSNNAAAAGLNGKPTLLSSATRTKYTFDLTTSTAKGLKDKALMDTMGAVTTKATGSGSVSEAGAASMAKRMADLKTKNVKASSRGVNLASKNQIAKASRSSASSAQMNAGAMAASSASNANNALGGSGYRVTLDEIKDEHAQSPSGASHDGSQGIGDTQSGGVGGAGMAGFGINASGVNSSQNAGSDSSSQSSSSTSGKDGTGLSDEEKEVMMANYERNRGEYRRDNEEDSLFKAVSKAYVRNLDKVLTKKKRVIEE